MGIGGGGGDLGGGDDEFALAPVAEINVTPLVDVMLVLLIVFMVAAPLMMAGVPVQLPKTSAAKLEQTQAPLIVSIDKEGSLFIDKDALSSETLPGRLRAEKTQSDARRVVLVRADKAVPYGRVMDVMGVIGAAGFGRVSLIAQAQGQVP